MLGSVVEGVVAGQDCPHPPSVLSYRAANTRPSSYQLPPPPPLSPVTITHLKCNICIAILIYCLSAAPAINLIVQIYSLKKYIITLRCT